MADATGEAEPAALRCYRHPDRETWVRCGRCDQPICPRCAMQGPVGFRCRECGRPAYDPLTSFTPLQIVGGLAIALGGGLVAGLLSSRIGFFVIFLSWFAGLFIADLVTRIIGFKRGALMTGLLVGGIVMGTAVGVGIDVAIYLSNYAALGEALLGQYLADTAPWAAVAAGIASAGALSRLR